MIYVRFVRKILADFYFLKIFWIIFIPKSTVKCGMDEQIPRYSLFHRVYKNESGQILTQLWCVLSIKTVFLPDTDHFHCILRSYNQSLTKKHKCRYIRFIDYAWQSGIELDMNDSLFHRVYDRGCTGCMIIYTGTCRVYLDILSFFSPLEYCKYNLYFTYCQG